MGEYQVKLIADEGIFKGLAKQNMQFHQCIAELVDNGVAATQEDKKFRIDIIFNKIEGNDDEVELYVCDNADGMDIETFKEALQLGKSATTTCRLNEHGFGMKNSLATLSGCNGIWEIWSKKGNEGNIFYAQGPFNSDMIIKDADTFPNYDFLPADISTLVKVTVKLSFIQTVQGRGAPSKDLTTLRKWLIEHLGVLYRGYLEQDSDSYEPSGVIAVSIGTNSQQVPPIQVPMSTMHTKHIDLEIGGNVESLEYKYGTLDEVKRDSLVRGDKARFYYQKNQPTQGIDIRLGKRVIATKQFETIWKTQDGTTQLNRHNNFNEFVGELLIPELPRCILTTTNNKTDFNLDDPDWQKIFDELNENCRPVKNEREKSETGLREKWMRMLKATNPEETITDEKSVWPTGTKIDVFREMEDGKIIIYELKVGTGTPIHLYQLKMYWDGLVLAGEKPKEGILLVEDFHTNLEEMANKMNELNPPEGSNPYNFKIERHKEKGL